MKVVQRTPNTLSFRWFSHLPLLSALGLVGVGILILAMGIKVTTLSCQRLASDSGEKLGTGGDRCELKTQQVLRTTTQTIPLKQIQSAKIQIYQRNEHISLYRVLLVTAAKPIPLTAHFSGDYLTQQHIVEQVELFIEDRDSTFLAMRDYGYAWIYFLGCLAIGIGVISILVGLEWTTVTFDHGANCLRVRHQRLLAHWTEEYNLQTITNVEIGGPITTLPHLTTAPHIRKSSSTLCLNIQFESGNRLPIALNPQEKPTKQIVRDIREFLHLSHNSTSGNSEHLT